MFFTIDVLILLLINFSLKPVIGTTVQTTTKSSAQVTTGVRTDGGKDLKDPIFLTPLIDDFRAEEARNMSLVRKIPSDTSDPPIVSYAGLITVNKRLKANLFFWFFPGPTSGPLILWLEGGPGITSLSTAFNGNGPFDVTENGSLIRRHFSWTNFSNVIYVDSPVGTGYSFAEDGSSFSHNSTDTASNLHAFMDQFFWLFPEYQSNEFYITASSYAAKDAAFLASKFHEDGVQSFINFQGILLMNPLVVPIIQVDYYADFFYQNGLISVNEFQHFKREQAKIRFFLRRGNPVSAYRVYDDLIGCRFTEGGKSYFKTVTGYSHLHGLQDMKHPEALDYFQSFVTRADVREAIHVGSIPFNARNDGVAAALIPDFMTSADRQLSQVMGRYRVAFLSGNLDVVVPVASVSRAVSSIRWRCQQDLQNADKQMGVWSVDQKQQVIGHMTSACDTYIIIIRYVIAYALLYILY